MPRKGGFAAGFTFPSERRLILLEPHEDVPLLVVGAEMDERRRLVFGQIVEARLDDHLFVVANVPGGALRLFIDRAVDRLSFVLDFAEIIAANHALLVEGQLENHVGLVRIGFHRARTRRAAATGLSRRPALCRFAGGHR